MSVFETREVTEDRFPFWKMNLQRISDWRNGIAVARYYEHACTPSYHYFLIDQKYNFLYSKICYDENELEGSQIERVFGGYYLVRDVARHCVRTFPGQDRDTEYSYSTYIKHVLDENGKELSEKEKEDYLRLHPIKHTTEYGEGVVECESSFFRLKDYAHLFDVPKILKPIGFFNGEKCKVSVVSDYRDFFVIVEDAKIKFVFDSERFVFITKLLGIDLNGLRERYPLHEYHPVCKPDDVKDVTIIKPDIAIEIQNYSLKLSLPFSLYDGGYPVHDDNYGGYRFKTIPLTSDFLVDGKWYEIRESDAQIVYEKLFEQECNRPNYIKDIEILASEIPLNGEKYSIYRFECRPYGYLSKDGVFSYDFDVDNIIW